MQKVQKAVELIYRRRPKAVTSVEIAECSGIVRPSGATALLDRYLRAGKVAKAWVGDCRAFRWAGDEDFVFEPARVAAPGECAICGRPTKKHRKTCMRKACTNELRSRSASVTAGQSDKGPHSDPACLLRPDGRIAAQLEQLTEAERRFVSWPGMALAVALMLGAGGAGAHEENDVDFTPWKTPAGGSCCDNRDCHKVEPCVLEDGSGVGFLPPWDGGECAPLDYSKVIETPEPVDGLFWCGGREWRDGTAQPLTRCLALGGES